MGSFTKNIKKTRHKDLSAKFVMSIGGGSMGVLQKIIDKYKKIPLPAKASLWFVFCSILQKGISFITVPIFTRIMSTTEYGIYSTYLSWYQMLLIFTSLNLYYGVFNNAMVKFQDRRDQYISSMQGIVVVLTFAFFGVYLAFTEAINRFLGLSTPLVLLLFVELLVTPALQFWTVRNRFEYKYRSIVAVTLAKSILNPVLGIIFVVFSPQKDVARVASVVLIEVCFCGAIAVYQFYRGKTFFDKEFWKFAILFNIPLIPHYLSGTILSQSDRIMIGKLVDNSAVAFYSVAYNIGVVINIIVTSINSSLTPWMYQKIKAGKAIEMKKIINLLLVLMAGLVFLVEFLAPEAMIILASKEYAGAVYVIPPVAAGTFFFFMYNVFANVEFYFEERRFVLIGSVMAAALNLHLNWIFIPIFGYYAAGYTTLVCYIIYGLSHLGFSKFVLNKHLNGEQIFDGRFIMFISIVVIAITIGLNYLYSYNPLRYGILAIILVMLLIKRQTVLNILKTAMALKRR